MGTFCFFTGKSTQILHVHGEREGGESGGEVNVDVLNEEIMSPLREEGGKRPTTDQMKKKKKAGK